MGNIFSRPIQYKIEIDELKEKIDIKNKQIEFYYDFLKKKCDENYNLLQYYFLLENNNIDNNKNDLDQIRLKIKKQNYKIKKIKDILEYEINILNKLKNKI
tara:strand:- start:521 stop:823 length:303 start_codon:yes stop_codon:yes gene_type:complete